MVAALGRLTTTVTDYLGVSVETTVHWIFALFLEVDLILSHWSIIVCVGQFYDL